MIGFYKNVKPLLVVPMHGEIRHLIAHKKVLEEKNIRAEIVRNGEIIEIDKELKIKKYSSDKPEKLFVDGKIIAKSDNVAFKERIKMSSEGLLIIQLRYKKSEQCQIVRFFPFGLPRFEDYSDELKMNSDAFLNNKVKKKNIKNFDEFERFLREELYYICGKKPIIKIVEME